MLLDWPSIDSETLCRSLGLVGVLIYITAFFALSVGRLDSKAPLYFGLVLTASSCVLVSLSVDFNLSAALIQAFYILMSTSAILLRLKRPRGRTRGAA